MLAFVSLLLLALNSVPALAQSSQPRTVHFLSADAKTTLTGYLFAPANRPKIASAVVLLPGRDGTYSSLAKGNYSSVTLNKHIRAWAELWAQQGYWALVVDSLGPRGVPAGIAAATDADDYVAGETLDAYGALRYLRASPRVRSDRIALEGWSTGASAVLSAMSKEILATTEIANGHGFRAALAFYPACGQQMHPHDSYAPYAVLRIFANSRNEDASEACKALAATSKAAGADIAVASLAAREFDPASGDAAPSGEARRQAIALLTATLGH